MDVESSFPYAGIEADLGEITAWEQFCGDIYRVTAICPDNLLPDEYYIFPANTQILSAAAKAYGSPLSSRPELLSVLHNVTGSGSTVIHYEVLRYLTRNKLPFPEGEDNYHVVAVYGMESNPEYFGAYPVPLITPHGYMLRYKVIFNGMFALETELGDRMVAIAYPIWADDLSDYTLQFGLKAFPDMAQDIHRTYGYLFFSEETACLALLELSRSYEYPADIINMAAVKNTVFQNFPDYMIQYNQNEISGRNDGIGRFYQMLGMEVELSGKEENLIALSPDVGTEYLIM